MMPDPEAKSVKDRLIEFKVTKNGWSNEVELKFAFPLVMPLAAQIIGHHFNPTDYTQGEAGEHISTESFGDEFTGPHLVFLERMSIPKPYIVKK